MTSTRALINLAQGSLHQQMDDLRHLEVIARGTTLGSAVVFAGTVGVGVSNALPMLLLTVGWVGVPFLVLLCICSAAALAGSFYAMTSRPWRVGPDLAEMSAAMTNINGGDLTDWVLGEYYESFRINGAILKIKYRGLGVAVWGLGIAGLGFVVMLGLVYY